MSVVTHDLAKMEEFLDKKMLRKLAGASRKAIKKGSKDLKKSRVNMSYKIIHLKKSDLRIRWEKEAFQKERFKGRFGIHFFSLKFNKRRRYGIPIFDFLTPGRKKIQNQKGVKVKRRKKLKYRVYRKKIPGITGQAGWTKSNDFVQQGKTKKLSVYRTTKRVGGKNRWLVQKAPGLKHLFDNDHFRKVLERKATFVTKKVFEQDLQKRLAKAKL